MREGASEPGVSSSGESSLVAGAFKRGLRAVVIAGRVVVILALTLSVSGCSEGTMNESPSVEPAGPRDSARIYWVGHSLNNHVDAEREGSRNMMEVVGALADAAGREHRSHDHTIWGASLRFNWQGNASWEERDDQKPLRDREYLREHGGEWDTFVFTEVLPIAGAIDWADSAYFLRTFYCEALRQRPNAEIFLYETWPNLQTAPPEAGPGWTFEGQLESDREIWESLADDALGDRIPNPGRLGRFLARVGIRDSHCAPIRPIRIIPGGAAMLALSRELRRLGAAAPRMPDGSALTMLSLVQNPQIDGATLRSPEKELDDIHPTAPASYFIGLVAYASIYRADPRGLPLLVDVGEEVAELLQRVAWEVVSDDPRVGVSMDAAEHHR